MKYNEKKTLCSTVIFIIVGVVIFSIILSSIFYLKNKDRYAFSYEIGPQDISTNSVKVNLHISNADNQLKLFNGLVDYSNIKCKSIKGEDIKYNEDANGISIFPERKEDIFFEYEVKIGKASKHGLLGSTYDDLMVFQGENVLMLPEIAYSGKDKEIKKAIAEINVNIKSEGQRQKAVKVMPFTSKNRLMANLRNTSDSKELQSNISSLNWSKVYNLLKSCYASGSLERMDGEKDGIKIYKDSQCQYNYDNATIKGINSLYNYYVNLFGYKIDDFSLVLLRKDKENDMLLMGGLSTQTMGATFDPDSSRDWQLLSHRLFHAFFDYKLTSIKYHTAPQLWLYEGLATYYENNSMNYIDSTIQKKLNLRDDFLALFKRYIYFSIKDRGILSIAPMNEEKFAISGGMTEFLHYTQAPLVVKTMEDMSYRKYGKRDRILKFILNKSNDENIDMKEIIKHALGDDSIPFSSKYLFGQDILPLWYLAQNSTEDENDVLEALNEFEYTLWSWFRLEEASYPIHKLSKDEINNVKLIKASKEIKFEDTNIEDNIYKISPTIYKLLKVYSKRAEVCGIDFKDPLIRLKLLGYDKNQIKWEEYKSSMKD